MAVSTQDVEMTMTVAGDDDGGPPGDGDCGSRTASDGATSGYTIYMAKPGLPTTMLCKTMEGPLSCVYDKGYEPGDHSRAGQQNYEVLDHAYDDISYTSTGSRVGGSGSTWDVTLSNYPFLPTGSRYVRPCPTASLMPGSYSHPTGICQRKIVWEYSEPNQDAGTYVLQFELEWDMSGWQNTGSSPIYYGASLVIDYGATLEDGIVPYNRQYITGIQNSLDGSSTGDEEYCKTYVMASKATLYVEITALVFSVGWPTGPGGFTIDSRDTMYHTIKKVRWQQVA